MALKFAILFFFASACTLVCLRVANALAVHVNLLDHPDVDRKFHKGSIPLTGGLALLISMIVSFGLANLGVLDIVLPPAQWGTLAILLTALVLAHIIDDIYELNALVRFVIDGGLALLICTIGLIKLSTLGDLFGFGEVTLGRYGVLMTIFSFIAASNAFNMTDGLDSLCSGLGLVAFGTLLVLVAMAHTPGNGPLIHVLAILIFALQPLYFANLGMLGSRLHSFLGDSGARLVGFVAGIVVIYAAEQGFIKPVMAFFPLAVPVCDCLWLMVLRMASGGSPFAADRRHLHHVILDLGFTIGQTRQIIIGAALVLSACGFALQLSDWSEWMIWALVIVTFWAYVALRLWLGSVVRARSARVTGTH